MDGGRLHAHLMTSNNIKDGRKDNRSNSSRDKDERINVDEPLWDQETYVGRWKHFAFVTDCRTIFSTKESLCNAKKLCEDYKAGREPKGTTRADIIWAKKLRDSAFHPDNGEMMNLIGRMSFQLPARITLVVGILACHNTVKGVVGWQVINQGFNAVVNYTNRNAQNEYHARKTVIRETFLAATGAGCAAALIFQKLMSSRGNQLMRHWAPFVAVSVSHMVNLPIMRQNEIKHGIDISAKDSKVVIMKSKVAALKGSSECVLSRIAMVSPSMILIPVIMNSLKPHCFYHKRPWLNLPIQTALSGLFLSAMIPGSLAIYPQRNSMSVKAMKLCRSESEEYQKLTNGIPDRVYYNKGL